MKRTRIIMALLSVISLGGYAQQEAQFTHYSYNTLAINPAYAGSREALTMTALGRFQWVGINGAPMTQTFTAHSTVASKSLGIGASFVNDKIGPTNTTGFFVDLAYRLKITNKSRLSFGLKGGINSFNAGLQDLSLQNQTDNSFSNNVRGKILPNAGIGIYYQSERFYAGISVPKVVENNLFGTTNSQSSGIEHRHYYFITGAVFRMTPQFDFKPTVLVKAVSGAPIQVDLTGSFILNDMFSFGGMVRVNSTVGALLGVNISEQFLVGYSFDWSTKLSTGRYNQGSHELMLRYDLISTKNKKIKSPRYF